MGFFDAKTKTVSLGYEDDNAFSKVWRAVSICISLHLYSL